MTNLAFNCGFLSATVMSGLMVWWIVSDCQNRSLIHQCNVGIEWNSNGVIHFTPSP